MSYDYNRPPLPPRPPSAPQTSSYKPRTASLPRAPAVPPLPPNWSSEEEQRFDAENSLGERWGGPVVAPRPQRLPGGTTDAAHTLEDAVVDTPGFYPPPGPQDYRRPSPAAPPPQNGAYYPPAGFMPPPGGRPSIAEPRGQPYPQQNYPAPPPDRYGPSPAPTARLGASPAPQNRLSPSPAIGLGNGMPNSPRPAQRIPSGTARAPHMHAMSLDAGAASLPAARQEHRRGTSVTASSSASNAPLIAALPNPAALEKTAPRADTKPEVSLSWIQSVLLLSSLSPAEAAQPSSSLGPSLATLLPQALNLLQELGDVEQPLPLAQFLRGTLLSSGAHPDFFPKDARAAFKDFERAARAGYEPAWFRLGRDYEGVGDLERAKECFERGVRGNERSCLYRMGMANLLGQLGLPTTPSAAIPLLMRAAALSTLEVPQPAYVLGMLLLSELPALPPLPPAVLQSAVPPNTTLQQHALSLIQTSAYLHFPPAQYKLGYAFENAQLGLPFDPLTSVRYYSFASQGGELEADMALSKWFLCGAEGMFDKDEALARTFAEKAAKKGLPSAEFAMGYYYEVGVGGRKDLEIARKWYEKAAANGNTDAPARLSALNASIPAPLSREEHENLTSSTLVRKRTQARDNAMAVGKVAPANNRQGREAVDAARRASLIRQAGLGGEGGGGAGLPAVREQSEDDVMRPSAPMSRPQQQVLPGNPRQNRTPPGSRRPSATVQRPLLETSPRTSSPNVVTPPFVPTPPPPAPNVVQTPHGRGYSLSETILPSPPAAQSPPVKKGPATFEEMGFRSNKLEEKECVIM